MCCFHVLEDRISEIFFYEFLHFIAWQGNIAYDAGERKLVMCVFSGSRELLGIEPVDGANGGNTMMKWRKLSRGHCIWNQRGWPLGWVVNDGSRGRDMKSSPATPRERERVESRVPARIMAKIRLDKINDDQNDVEWSSSTPHGLAWETEKLRMGKQQDVPMVLHRVTILLKAFPLTPLQNSLRQFPFLLLINLWPPCQSVQELTVAPIKPSRWGSKWDVFFYSLKLQRQSPL